MNVPLWLSILAMATGVILIIRASFIVMSKGGGRFRGDPLITMVLGFGLMLLGQFLLR